MVRLEGMKDLCQHRGIWNKNASRQLTTKPVLNGFFLKEISDKKFTHIVNYVM